MKMPPTSAFMVQGDNFEEPISRTYQYRKVMKPMLERKRRARINRCLDELKELMVTALQAEGENVSKLEKADILELTVKHLHNLKRQHHGATSPSSAAAAASLSSPEQNYADRFRAGFTHCATEVSNFLSTPKDSIDPCASAKLLQHLNACIRRLEAGVIAPQPINPQPINLANTHQLPYSLNNMPVNRLNPINPSMRDNMIKSEKIIVKQEPINLVQQHQQHQHQQHHQQPQSQHHQVSNYHTQSTTKMPTNGNRANHNMILMDQVNLRIHANRALSSYTGAQHSHELNRRVVNHQHTPSANCPILSDKSTENVWRPW